MTDQNNAFRWTLANVARLRELWPTLTTVLEIADELGTNKNTVIGKAYRMGLPAKPDSRRKYTRRDQPLPEHRRLPSASPPNPRTCMHVESLDPVTYCGEPVFKRGWCEQHWKIVYVQKPTPEGSPADEVSSDV